MNFITFPVAATNLFPCANSHAGGQLATEWNLKSRETICTDPRVVYSIGPSFVHGERDFEVNILQDSGGAIVNPYTLSIAEGRGVINGHYVETLTPMTIDLLEANLKLQSQARPILKGALAIGIRTFFSTDQTVAGSILVENDEDMYLGVQLVVLPEEDLITPSDSPDDPNKVNCDLKLATFSFLNNAIVNLVNLYTTKLQYIHSERITDLANVVSSRYVTKIGLNSKKLYAFAGKGTDPETGADTWEDVTDSMMIWDAEPQRTTDKPVYRQAEFISTGTDVKLVLPHKPVIGMTTDEGLNEYYEPRIMTLPNASYAEGTSGLVNKSYTDQIKEIARQVSLFRTTLTGKQIYYMQLRSTTDELPPINDSWDYGDYVLVGVDDYYNGGSGDTTQSPSTMYVVLPGLVESVKFVAQLEGDAIHEPGIPENIVGAELGFQEWYQASGQSKPDTEHPEYYPTFYSPYDNMRGVPYSDTEELYYDYFRIRYYIEEDPSVTNPSYPFIDYFYGVYRSGQKDWSDAVLVTGGLPFATEDYLGGFLNVSDEARDYGYVYLDDTGHLRLLDYSLLRSGTLAYQIPNDITIPTNDDFTELQYSLDEYVNDRVAFPSSGGHGRYSTVLNIYLTLPATSEDEVLEIRGIDSRFNTAVCLHVLGEGTSNVTLNIVDCEKFMIDPTINGTPTINIFRTCLYYNPSVLQYIKTCYRDTSVYGDYTGFQDLKLWYEKLSEEDPKLVVDGMTVAELDSPVISSSINYWKELGSAINDNNYLVALRSITFSGAGDIVGCQVLAANNSTDNIDPGDKIVVGDFILPQGENLIYPVACMSRILKITGTFTSAYYSDQNWYVTDTSFTMQTGVYDAASTGTLTSGTVAFHSVTSLVRSTIAQTSIAPWEPDSYHIFAGGAIS